MYIQKVKLRPGHINSFVNLFHFAILQKCFLASKYFFLKKVFIVFNIYFTEWKIRFCLWLLPASLVGPSTLTLCLNPASGLWMRRSSLNTLPPCRFLQMGLHFQRALQGPHACWLPCSHTPPAPLLHRSQTRGQTSADLPSQPALWATWCFSLAGLVSLPILLIWGKSIQSLRTCVSSSVEPEASVTFKATWSRAEVGQCFSEKDQVKSIVHSGGCMISRPVTHLCQQQHAQKQP